MLSYLSRVGDFKMSKYNWSKVPKNISSIATDSNGRVLGYDVKEPNIASNKDGSIGSYTGSYYWLLTNQKPYYGNWKDSLEERPDD